MHWMKLLQSALELQAGFTVAEDEEETEDDTEEWKNSRWKCDEF